VKYVETFFMISELMNSKKLPIGVNTIVRTIMPTFLYILNMLSEASSSV
jgi:hypothetical protein